MLRAQRKKSTIGGGVEISHPEPEELNEAHNLRSYLDKLFMLLLAYAIAGAKPVKGAPDKEKRGDDTTKFVIVPLDQCIKYHTRVCRFAYSVPYPSALEMVRKRDEGDREMWIDYYRGGSSTLGEVMQKVYEVRDATWQPPEEQARKGSAQEGTPRGRDRDRKKPPARSRTPPRPPKPVAPRLRQSDLLDKMKNGEPLCPDYQWGKCSKTPCPKGKHVCAKMRGAGRVCGGAHPAIKCTVNLAKQTEMPRRR